MLFGHLGIYSQGSNDFFSELLKNKLLSYIVSLSD